MRHQSDLDCNDKYLEDYNTNLKVAPPIRDSLSREALIKGIKNGTIDCRLVYYPLISGKY